MGTAEPSKELQRGAGTRTNSVYARINKDICKN